jgi:chromate transport protein ChrA
MPIISTAIVTQKMYNFLVCSQRMVEKIKMAVFIFFSKSLVKVFFVGIEVFFLTLIIVTFKLVSSLRALLKSTETVFENLY